MAEAAGSASPPVQRIWRSHALRPHRARRFKLSTDPQFAAELRDSSGSRRSGTFSCASTRRCGQRRPWRPASNPALVGGGCRCAARWRHSVYRRLNASIRNYVVEAHGWLTDREFANFFAIANSLPGPNMILMMSLIGWSVGGLPTALASALATFGPPCAIYYFT